MFTKCKWVLGLAVAATMLTAAAARAELESGLKIGVKVLPDTQFAPKGLRIQSVDAGGPANGFLQPGDKIVKLTDLATGREYVTQSVKQIEFAKSQIGTNWAEVEILRGNRQGVTFVQLSPAGGGLPCFANVAPKRK